MSSLNLTIIKRILYKTQLLKAHNPNHKLIKLLLLIDSGGMRGIVSMGNCLGLEKLELTEVFDDIVTISAGTANGGFFLAKQSALACTVYTDDLVDRRFINPLRFWKVTDIDYVNDIVFRHVKKLDTEAIRKSRPNFFACVTRVDDGNGEFMDVKKQVDIISVIKASMAMLVLYNKPIKIGNNYYVDGLTSMGLPIDEIIDQFSPTDILVLLNRPLGYCRPKLSVIEKSISKLYLRKFPQALKNSFFDMNRKYSHQINTLRECGNNYRGVNIGIIHPDYEAIKRTTKNRDLLLQAAQKAEQDIYNILGKR